MPPAALGFRSTRVPGVYVRHRGRCPAAAREDARCRCQPSWRVRRRNALTGKAEWSRATRDRGEALAWRAAAIAEVRAEPRRLHPSLTFREIAERWWMASSAARSASDGAPAIRTPKRRCRATAVTSMVRRPAYMAIA